MNYLQGSRFAHFQTENTGVVVNVRPGEVQVVYDNSSTLHWLPVSHIRPALYGEKRVNGKLVSAPVEQNVVQLSGEQTRTNQLLNELYHDRARLERVVKDAANLCDKAQAMIDGLPVHNSIGREIEKDVLIGWLTQFAFEHGGITAAIPV